MEYKDQSFENLMKLVKENKTPNSTIIEKTYKLVKEDCKGEKRISGKPKTQHLLNTAYRLAEMKLNANTIAAGLAHDFLDVSDEKKDVLRKETNKTVTKLVEELAVMDQVVTKNVEKIATKNLINVLLANTTDVRTIMIDLAATLDNLRNMEKLNKEKKNIETKLAAELFVPLSHKLGLYSIEWELRDLSFKILKPDKYYEIKKAVNEKRKTRDNIINSFVKELEEKLEEKKLEVGIQGRVKSFAGIYEKMKRKQKKANELMDLFGVRILCDSVEDCYTILGIIHANYDLLPHHFDDYIANPKPNNYRSLHTVIEWKNKKIEIQVRTHEMHSEAEEGIAAHWQYKEIKETPYFDKKLTWAKQLVNLQQKNPSMLKNFKIDLGSRNIFVFTPKKQVVMLPVKATPLDFAFSLHTQLGFLCEQTLVNGKKVALDHKLKNGDSVEIIKSQKAEVKKSWLKMVKTEKAKLKIRKKLKLPLKSPKKKEEKKERVKEKNITAKCCNPLPGDKVFGYKTTKRKLIIHRMSCKNKKNLMKEGIVSTKLERKKGEEYRTKIRITGLGDPKAMARILKILSAEDVPIKSTTEKSKEESIMKTELEIVVKNLKHLEKLIGKIEKIPGILEVKRI